MKCESAKSKKYTVDKRRRNIHSDIST